jgi:hypothetical protein
MAFIRDTFLALKLDNLGQVVSTVNRKKNMVYMAFPSTSTNDTILVWNFFTNSWSIYKGMAPAAMMTAYRGGYDERPIFADYAGYVYRMDVGVDDYPLNVRTAINGYYWTNWKTFDELISKKGVPEVTIYYAQNEATLTFGYAFDFLSTTQFSNTFPTSNSTAMKWDTGIWDEGTWGDIGGGGVVRRDLTGRGRVVRMKIANNNIGETFRIDGFGMLAQLETNI